MGRQVKHQYKMRDDYFKGQKLRYTREGWMLEHPEDKDLDDENMRARKTGYADDDVRHLMSAICLRACADYKRAVHGLCIGEKQREALQPDEAIAELREFFGSEIFQYFVNGMKVKDIESYIRSTPPGSIHSLWRKIEDSQQPIEV